MAGRGQKQAFILVSFPLNLRVLWHLVWEPHDLPNRIVSGGAVKTVFLALAPGPGSSRARAYQGRAPITWRANRIITA